MRLCVCVCVWLRIIWTNRWRNTKKKKHMGLTEACTRKEDWTRKMACVGAHGSGSFSLTDYYSRLRPLQEVTLSPPPPSLSFSPSRSRPRSRIARMATLPTLKAEAVSIEKSGVKIVRNPPESKLSELGVRSWPKWGCPPSKFPWSYSAKETCFLLEGKVKVYPDGSEEPVEIAAGDLVEFPKGMSCTWDVSVGVDKHYRFD